jgi:hypothetical protein
MARFYSGSRNRRRRYGRRNRRYGGHRARPRVIVPPSDANNFFLPNDDCGKYVSTRFTGKQNYGAQECHQFVMYINDKYVLNPYFGLGLCGIGCLIVYVGGAITQSPYSNIGWLFCIAFCCYLVYGSEKKKQCV